MKTEGRIVLTAIILLVFAVLAIASGDTGSSNGSSNSGNEHAGQSGSQSESGESSNSFGGGVSFSADESGKVTGTPGTQVFERGEISVDFSSGSVKTEGVEDYSSSGCRIEDRYDSSYHLYMFQGSSFAFDVDMPGGVTSASLRIRHLTSASGSEEGYAPVSLYVNNSKVANWSSLGGSYQDDYYDISSYLNSGSNRISLNYSSGSGETGYWVKSIKLVI
ncbi:MAG: hypothetical protein LHW45_06550 [Candidatus Cloacimonetes bacterium]|jgi:hypothetical protein|nr:hypothetical protein [Candidatus Cloacimonadota bacterium]MDY0367270.1 hypothetical protein [Candidatus Syntrophosphaera sp.]HOY85063.1 hypothetical protein [Candidatus Syntrophosphaera sp.]